MTDFCYDKFFCNERERKSTIQRENSVEEYYSDRSRIIYCSSFRRMQQKAQVFCLEPNSSVRTRLTHSIEVSDLGRTLANKIGRELLKNEYIDENRIPQMVAIVENACLLHDIGNPPFGHFGEAAIQEWSRDKLESISKKAEINNKSELYNILTADFREFDGNPQGFRILTKLHCEQDKYSLNLSYATLLCALKYARAAGEEKGDGILKKAGYFQTEKKVVEKIYQTVGISPHHRFPFTYIMEAADDIAYCLSDIGDGIEKRIIANQDFIDAFTEEWKKLYKSVPCPVEIPEKIDHFNLDLSVKWSKKIVDSAVENYLKKHSSFYNGVGVELIEENGMGRILETIKQVSRQLLYRSPEAENMELTGYAVITGLLNHFTRLLELPYERFSYFVDPSKNPQRQNLDLEWRLFNRIGKRYVQAYHYALEDYREGPYLDLYEWWLRVHMIIDHINGMTDDFALATYQMLEGISIYKY